MDNSHSFSYNFPEVILPDDHTINAQLDKVREEIDEAVADIIFERRIDALRECVDVLVAAETLHRIMVRRVGIERVNEAIAWVKAKNSARGYTDEASQN